MRWFTSSESVAAITRNCPSRSPGRKARSSQTIEPSRAHWLTRSFTSNAITRTVAPACSKLWIFGSATLPPPTTRHHRPVSFINIGKSSIDSFHTRRPSALTFRSVRHPSRRLVARSRLDHVARQKFPQLLFAVPREKSPQVLPRELVVEISAQQALDRVRHFGSNTPISNWTRHRRVFSNRAAQAEVVRIHQLVTMLDFFALNTDVRDPVLSATVRASGHVQLQMLLETGKPLFQFLHQPSRKTLRLRQSEFAEFTAGARNGSPPEWRRTHRQSYCFQLFRQLRRVLLRDIHHHQVLHIGGPQITVGVLVCQVGSRAHLLSRDPSPQHCRADVCQSRMFLRMNADVVAINILRRLLRNSRAQPEPDSPLQFLLETFSRPSVA